MKPAVYLRRQLTSLSGLELALKLFADRQMHFTGRASGVFKTNSKASAGCYISIREFSSENNRSLPLKFKPFTGDISKYESEDNNDMSEEIDEGQKISALNFRRGQEVNIRITQMSALGATVSINDGECEGMVFRKNIELYYSSQNLSKASNFNIGRNLKGFISRVQVDGKVDVSLFPLGKNKALENKKRLMAFLKAFPILPLGDRSSPADIEFLLCGMSKVEFKTAVGTLFKERLIIPNKNFIILAVEANKIPKYYIDSNITNGDDSINSESGNSSADINLNIINKLREINNNIAVDIFNVAKTVKEADIISVVQSICGTETVDKSSILKSVYFYRTGTARVEVTNPDLVMLIIDKLKNINLQGRSIVAEVVDPYQQRFFELFVLLKEQNLISLPIADIFQGDLNLRLTQGKRVVLDLIPSKKNDTEPSRNSKPTKKDFSAILNNVSSENKNIKNKGNDEFKAVKRNNKTNTAKSSGQYRSGVGTLSSEHEFRVYNEDLVLDTDGDDEGSEQRKGKASTRSKSGAKVYNNDLEKRSDFGGGFI